MVDKTIIVFLTAPVTIAGILILTLFTVTGIAQQPLAGCGPGTDNSTCSSTTNQQPQAAPTAGCGPGTDNSTCSATPTPPTTPTSGCGPGTDNSTCTPTPTPTPTPGNASSSQQSNNTDFVNTILEIHN